MQLKKYLDYLVKFIYITVKNANASGVIVGISGGVDSAVVACLAKQAFPKNYLTVWIPIESSKQDFKCKEKLIKQCKLKSIDVNLKSTYTSFKKAIKNSNTPYHKLGLANAKARLRMTSLYSVAQANNYLVVGTDNWDEWHIGYFTKFGDGGVDLIPLVHLLKREVKQAAQLLGVPALIINRAPTASLWKNQTDEKELGITYTEIDAYLAGESATQKVKDYIDYLNKISKHKRQGAIAPIKFIRK